MANDSGGKLVLTYFIMPEDEQLVLQKNRFNMCSGQRDNCWMSNGMRTDGFSALYIYDVT